MYFACREILLSPTESNEWRGTPCFSNSGSEIGRENVGANVMRKYSLPQLGYEWCILLHRMG
jgi:hypothetical protein